jgi:hypothetical protein
MEQKEVIEGNELIRQFMGRGVAHDPRDNIYHYHDSWDWLMPVVEKIEQGNYGIKMYRKVVEIYFDDTKAIILRTKEKSRLESLYKAVVEFMLLNQPEPKES